MLKLGKRLFTNAKYENIKLSVHDKVALIQLCRPEALNSLNSKIICELRDSLSILENNESVACAVLTGDSKSFAGTWNKKENIIVTFSWRRYSRNEYNELFRLHKIKLFIWMGGHCQI